MLKKINSVGCGGYVLLDSSGTIKGGATILKPENPPIEDSDSYVDSTNSSTPYYSEYMTATTFRTYTSKYEYASTGRYMFGIESRIDPMLLNYRYIY